jgi:hypothetical protein
MAEIATHATYDIGPPSPGRPPCRAASRANECQHQGLNDKASMQNRFLTAE